MCGIAGIVNIGRHQVNAAAIQAMTASIEHRGPDAEGIYVNEFVALGHRRLSIIDLKESANQPMTDDSQRYLIIYNGEIYNYLEVKAQLTDYPYHTDSDTEVILAAFRKWGTESVKKFNGQFAFAIWDKEQKELFIARDRLGKKPLYYYLCSEYFIFCSEVRSLLSSGLVPRNLNEDNLPEFLMYQAPMDSHTLVKGVKQLKAGHYAIIKNGQFKEASYWKFEDIQPSGDDYATAKNKIKDLFIDAVRLRMISDVPIGAFLSGGIDSSLVVACMAELSEKPIHTFCISFHEKEFDESLYALIIAKKYKTDHQNIVIKPAEFLDSIEEILAAMDSPSGDGPNTFMVAKRTREAGIKVALSGLGGDELFVGYNKFMLYQKIMKHRWILKFPVGLRRKISGMMLASSGNHRNSKLADLVELDDWNLATVYPQLRKSYRADDVNELLAAPVKEDYVESKLAQIERATSWMGKFSQCTIGELETYTRDVLLRDSDQMAMAHALEVRVPFFDYRLVEYILSLPDTYKFPHTPKKLLVDSLTPRLPSEIVNRRKMGFSFPLEHWLKNELFDAVDQKLTCLADRKEFNSDVVKNKWKQFQQGDKRILWPAIWQLVVLSDWLSRNKL